MAEWDDISKELLVVLNMEGLFKDDKKIDEIFFEIKSEALI